MKLIQTARAAMRLCGVLFCCAGFALGQSMRASNAEVDASAPSVEVTATSHAAVVASVPGIAIRAYDVGTVGSYSKGGEAVTTPYWGTGIDLRHGENRSPMLGAARIDNVNAKSLLKTRTRHAVGSKLSFKEDGALHRYETGQMRNDALHAMAMERMAAGAGKATAIKRVSGLIGAYTMDFPDSTKGTALISPPDKGTASPLEWSLGLDFSFPDFTKNEFLSPSLHAARRGSKLRGERANLFGRRRMKLSVESKPRVDLPETNLPSLETSVPSVDSPLLSPLDQP